MTKYQILLGIWTFLDQEYDKDNNKSDEYIYYISNVNPNIWQDEGTADPAYLADFMKICDSFLKDNECTLEDGLIYAKKYLEEYNRIEHMRFSSNIDEVVSTFSKCTIADWKEICNKLLHTGAIK